MLHAWSCIKMICEFGTELDWYRNSENLYSFYRIVSIQLYVWLLPASLLTGHIIPDDNHELLHWQHIFVDGNPIRS